MSHDSPLGRLARPATYALISALALAAVACGSDERSNDEATPAVPRTSVSGAAPATSLLDRGYAEGHRLVTSGWLTDHVRDDDLVVVDLRDAEDYASGHIPGAVNIVPGPALSATDANGVNGQIAPPQQVARALSDAGIEHSDTIVLYDAGTSLWAARALWVLDVYRHPETRILDGGWSLWSAEDRAVSTDPPTVTSTPYVFAAEPNSDIIATFDEIIAGAGDTSKLVYDARSPEEYAGRDVRSARGGHVPGAVNEDWRQAIDDDSRFRSAEELRAIYDELLLRSDTASTVHVYCQTGVRAAHTWFVLSDLLGLEHVKNYDGSWEEYGNRADAEVERS